MMRLKVSLGSDDGTRWNGLEGVEVANVVRERHVSKIPTVKTRSGHGAMCARGGWGLDRIDRKTSGSHCEMRSIICRHCRTAKPLQLCRVNVNILFIYMAGWRCTSSAIPLCLQTVCTAKLDRASSRAVRQPCSRLRYRRRNVAASSADQTQRRPKVYQAGRPRCRQSPRHLQALLLRLQSQSRTHQSTSIDVTAVA